MLILSRLKKFKKNYNKDIGFTFGEIWFFFCCNNMALLISFSADFFLSKKKIRKKKILGKQYYCRTDIINPLFRKEFQCSVTYK